MSVDMINLVNNLTELHSRDLNIHAVTWLLVWAMIRVYKKFHLYKKMKKKKASI